MSENVQPQNKMGTAKMLPLIFSMALPAMFSMMVQALYNIVDTYFVSQVSEKAMAAVSLAFPIQNLQIAFAVGTAVGVTSLISRRLGEGRKAEAESAASHGIVLGLCTAAVFAVYGAFFTTPFFKMFESDPEIVLMGDQYISVCCIFSFGSFVVVMLEKILQATGNMLWPMIFQLVGALINIALDPVFIFGYFGLPAMGVTGAAIATVGGQIISMIFAAIVFAVRPHAISISFKGFRPRWKTIKNIYAVGLPAIVMQAIGTVMNMAMNGILSGFSTAAYTVFGLYFKLQSFVFMPVFGLTQGLLPIMGFNYGARNKKRLMQALSQGCLIALFIMLAGMLAFLLLPDKLLGIFNASEELLHIGVPALRTICICFIFAALGIVSSTLFQAVGRGTYSLIVSIMRQLAVLVPSAWLLSRIFGEVNAVWWAFPVAETVSLLVSVFFFMRLYTREIKSLDKKGAAQ
ncbi:MATE family efflux transporter [Acutalibacter sp. 1XD8-36]|uniref:MATE family efflux transporter n=1 Tax=Acutalibacter sp. 1XD8-36 TaxID=2320852 RepID=UPI001411CA58|nr:MATE family efflux transporter [Acutalibacter sp. 1XD8-36]NBJ88857.1 MATE family efflux transporter [Acutalibacter sp. 1XD8-36]